MRRVVAHCDIDAFYASVELLERPDLRGKPLVVAGTGPRAVVTTASYEARRFGIDSAMPAARARALCPHAVFLAPNFTAYRAKSRDVWELVRGRIERIQQVGIDEAYLDVSDAEKPLRVLRELVAEIRERTGMTMSVGVGPSRLVAKTVSAVLGPTPWRIRVGDVQRCEERVLVECFGDRMGRYLRSRAWFFDDSPVQAPGAAKSRSNETTFPEDVSDRSELELTLRRLAEELCSTLQRREVRGRTIAIKVRLDDWTTVTRARTVPERTNDPADVIPVVLDLFRRYDPARPVRLLGVRLAAFEHEPATPSDPVGQLVLPFAEIAAA